MSSAAFHFAGGDAFFTGAALLLVASLAGLRSQGAVPRRVLRLLALGGGLFVALSAVPLPPWLYAAWAGALIASLAAPRLVRAERRGRAAGAARLLLAIATLAAVAWETPFRRTPPLPSDTEPVLWVIGDSISAGMLGPDEPTWPRQFRDLYQVDVRDLSEMGATARSALKQAARMEDAAGVVLIEIGGNDLLGGRAAAQFAADLEELLETVWHPDRRLVMLELPLPPLYNGYGRVQRDLASRYNVALVPRRAFAEVLASREATLDGLHLSEIGHRKMAEMVWRHLRGALERGLAESL